MRPFFVNNIAFGYNQKYGEIEIWPFIIIVSGTGPYKVENNIEIN